MAAHQHEECDQVNNDSDELAAGRTDSDGLTVKLQTPQSITSDMCRLFLPKPPPSRQSIAVQSYDSFDHSYSSATAIDESPVKSSMTGIFINHSVDLPDALEESPGQAKCTSGRDLLPKQPG